MSWEGEPYKFTLLEPEDEPTTKRYVYHPESIEDWPGQLRRGSLFLPVVALAVALCPLIVVIIWLMGR